MCRGEKKIFLRLSVSREEEAIKLKPGDRVVMSPMWKYNFARGKLIKITRDKYYIVRWDNINGDWHYTEEQAKRLYKENIPEDEKALWQTWGDK